MEVSTNYLWALWALKSNGRIFKYLLAMPGGPRSMLRYLPGVEGDGASKGRGGGGKGTLYPGYAIVLGMVGAANRAALELYALLDNPHELPDPSPQDLTIQLLASVQFTYQISFGCTFYLPCISLVYILLTK